MKMFEQEYRTRINRVVEFIEQNLDKPLTLQMLAQEAGISPFHLHRLFLIYTGEPLSGFIRRTRLAAGYLEFQKSSRSSVVETAISVGYESVSSFVRAFRKRFGFTPKALVKAKNSLALWRTQRAETDKVVAEPQRIDLQAPKGIFGVMEKGYQNRSFQKAAERAFAKVQQRIQHHSLQAHTGRPCAVMFGDPDLDDPMELRYFGGFEWLGNEAFRFEGLEWMPIASGLFAVFVHRGSYRNLWQTWNVAYRNWLPNSEYGLRDAFPFEIYLTDPRTVRSDSELLTEIYIPIHRR
jgi:AraC family transcriptional regulator